MEDARSIPCSYHVEIPARQTEPEKIWRWLSGLKRKQRSVETENEAEEEQGWGEAFKLARIRSTHSRHSCGANPLSECGCRQSGIQSGRSRPISRIGANFHNSTSLKLSSALGGALLFAE